ncbi:GNAT family N-acetyltransferase [Ascidiimonas sp. W6]|uniref:GNAT family N-acetyltransferase n=1 Tax=Ascidiimonas meishanensis TaxID=3128903 RepID=UPI0030EB60B9
MEIKIKHQDKETKGIFFVQHRGKIFAEVTYCKAGMDKIIIDHTRNEKSLSGQDLVGKLVKVAVDYTLKGLLKTLPFVNAEFKKHSAYENVKA